MKSKGEIDKQWNAFPEACPQVVVQLKAYFKQVVALQWLVFLHWQPIAELLKFSWNAPERIKSLQWQDVFPYTVQSRGLVHQSTIDRLDGTLINAYTL